jgi:acetoin utilization deacetylase AcuC-like enzyme
VDEDALKVASTQNNNDDNNDDSKKCAFFQEETKTEPEAKTGRGVAMAVTESKTNECTDSDPGSDPPAPAAHITQQPQRKTTETATVTCPTATALAMHAPESPRWAASAASAVRMKGLGAQCQQQPQQGPSPMLQPDQLSKLSKLLNKRAPQGDTPLLMACRLDPSTTSQDIVFGLCSTLLEFGASVTMRTAQNSLPLHLTARCGFERVGRLLLNKGCPASAVDGNGETAVHVAARAGHPAFLQLLTEFGANCHIRNREARAAIDCVHDNRDLYLLEHMSETSTLSPRSQAQAKRRARDEVRRVILCSEPRLRTLILFHEDCLDHSARRASDWEGPDRLQAIMARLRNLQEFPSHELDISSCFEKASVELLSRVHSHEYITFVDNLSKKIQEGGSGPDGSATQSATGEGAVIPFTPHVQKAMFSQAQDQLKSPDFSDTAFSAGTLRAARRAAGAVAHAVDRVLLGRNRNAFCVVRPPGHHAGYRGLLDGGRSCGFCIFNSVAAGALHALEAHNVERVAIVDLDIHHGNGTEDIVQRYPHPLRLFFFSMHIFDKEETYEFFPGTGAQDDTMHNIINVPILPLWHEKDKKMVSGGTRAARAAAQVLNSGDESSIGHDETERLGTSGSHNSSNSSNSSSSSSNNNNGSGGGSSGASDVSSHKSGRLAYRRAISQRLVPALRAFSPSLILLSQGFDAAQGDVGNSKIGPGGVDPGMNLLPRDFEWATTEIMRVADICCGGRIVSCLEGGYGGLCKPATRGAGARAAAAAAAAATAAAAAAAVGSTAPEAPTGGVLDRGLLAQSAAAHVRRLVDPFG